MKNNDLIIVSSLRENSREALTVMSKRTRIPVSTLYDKLKEYNNGNIINKFTSIVDFSKLGYKTKVQVMIKPHSETRTDVEKFLMSSNLINSLYRVGTTFEYMAEVVCKDIQSLHTFLSRLDELRVLQKEVIFVVDDLRREEFLTTRYFDEI